jgi:hypothetical protein
VPEPTPFTPAAAAEPDGDARVRRALAEAEEARARAKKLIELLRYQCLRAAALLDPTVDPWKREHGPGPGKGNGKPGK